MNSRWNVVARGETLTFAMVSCVLASTCYALLFVLPATATISLFVSDRIQNIGFVDTFLSPSSSLAAAWILLFVSLTALALGSEFVRHARTVGLVDVAERAG